MISAISSTNFGASPPDGSSSRSKLRAGHERAGDGDHLLLAARHGAHDLAAPLGKTREVAIDGREARRAASTAPRCEAPSFRLSSTDMSGNRSRAWLTCAMPRRKIWCGGRPAMSCPSNSMRPPNGLMKPLTALSAVDLPLPLAPSRTTTSPLRTVKSTPNRICLPG